MPTLQKENPPRIYKYATDIMDIKKTVRSTFSYLELTLDIHHEFINTLTTHHDLFDHSSTKFRPYIIVKLYLTQVSKSLGKARPFSVYTT